ncbi:MAG: hypothetical protein ACK4GM_12515 [Tabrizicola sp.]
MTSRLSLLFASTSLTLALGLPSLAAVPTPASTTDRCGGICAAVFSADDFTVQLIRVSGDDDDHDEEDDEDDDDHEDDDDRAEHCEEDDGDDQVCMRTGGRGNPARAGTVAPPANGLFGNGAPPAVVTR